jgi:hypothetical protein
MSRPDIESEIDALVDAQLKQRRNNQDDNVNRARCSRCGRRWHGLRLTERVAIMYELGYFDTTYVAAEDFSSIICEGPDFIGPLRPPTRAMAQLDVAVRDFPGQREYAVGDFLSMSLVVVLGMWPVLLCAVHGVAAFLVVRSLRRCRPWNGGRLMYRKR